MSEHRILFRVDGSSTIGMGHVMRCLRLAGKIQKLYPCELTFVTSTPDSLNSLLKTYVSDAKLHVVENEDIDALSLLYDELDPHVIVSDTNFKNQIDDYIRMVEKYPYHVNIHEMHFNHFPFGLIVFASILPAKPKCACESKAVYLTGADYVMVDPELSDLDIPEFSPDKQMRVLLTPGGADPMKNTEKLLELLTRWNPDPQKFHVTLVVGPANERICKIGEIVKGIEFASIVQAVSDLRDLFRNSDIVITNGGTTIYEALAAGRPSWVIPQNEFEQEVGNLLLKKNAVMGVGLRGLEEELSIYSEGTQNFHEKLSKTASTGRGIIDGKGIIRIADKIIDVIKAIDYFKAD